MGPFAPRQVRIGEKYGLDCSGSDHAIGNAAYRAGRDVERLFGERTPEPAERVVEHHDQPVAIGPEHRSHDQRQNHLHKAVSEGSRRADHELLEIGRVGFEQRAQVALDLYHAIPSAAQPRAEQRHALDPARLFRRCCEIGFYTLRAANQLIGQVRSKGEQG